MRIMQPGDQVEIDSARLVMVRHKRDGGWLAGQVLVEAGPAGLQGLVLSVAGVLPGAELDRFYRLRLQFDPHPRYGEQWRVLHAQAAMPLSRKGLETYLKLHIHGIGSRRSKQLLDAFGIELPTVLAADDAVAQLRRRVSLPAKVAQALVTEWRSVRDRAELDIALHGAGCSAAQIGRMWDRFGVALATVVSQTPYRLMAVHGVGFSLADAIARHVGLAADDPERLLAAAVEVARRAANDGHCWTGWQSLCVQAAALIDGDPVQVGLALTEQVDQEQRKQVLLVDTQHRAWLTYLYRAHQVLVQIIGQRRQGERVLPPAHSLIPNRDGLQLTGEQQTAVQGVLRHMISVLTGGPGTGKTTVVRSIIDAMQAHFADPVIRLAAPTGKAARRLSESAGMEACTIHRLLEWQIDAPKRDRDRPLVADLVIIDEASMLDHELAALLLQAVPHICPIVFVGDVDQLPSVGPGQFLADLIAAGIATYRLSQVQRQAESSLIIQGAGHIRDGCMPRFADAPGADLYFIGDLAPEAVVERIVRFVCRDVPERLRIGSDQVRVLVPHYRGACGIDHLNEILRERLNPPAPDKRECMFGKQQSLRVGDRLVWLSNVPEHELVNGSELRLLQLEGPNDKPIAILETDDGRHVQMPAHQMDVRLAYALSVHKSQGSEYPAALVVMDFASGPLLSRRLLYTAVTRAKRLCVILGRRAAVERAISNDRDLQRRSGLADDLLGQRPSP